MRRTNLSALVLAAVATALLGGCQLVGPKSIDEGRDRYNSIIQRTSMEQTMANIVRVYRHQPPFFMDVTEVDSTVTFGGSINGASTNIGAKHGAPSSSSTVAGQVGSAGGTLQYSELPVIRYTPLLGQALVAQLVTPVSVDALGLLYDLGWPIAPLLDFSSAYLTLDDSKYYSALDTIIELSDNGALEFAAAKSDLSPAQSAGEQSAISIVAGAGKQKSELANNDSLIAYLRPFPQYENSADLAERKHILQRRERILQLWVRMFRLYHENQPPFIALQDLGCTSDLSKKSPNKLSAKPIGLTPDNDEELREWDVDIEKKIAAAGPDEKEQNDLVERARKCLPNFIELRVVPLTN